MNKIEKLLKFTILSIIIATFQLVNYKPFISNAYTVSSAEYVMEVNSKRVIHAYNENEKLPMASTTKILTAITVIDNFDLDKEIKVDKKCVNIEGSSIYLREGEVLTVKELLYGLMLRSGNDCATVLANQIIPYNDFIALMNDTAKKLGANNSNFVNPHGLPNDNHYTTAKDLALISAYAIQNEVFKEIVSTKKINISNDGYDYDRVLINKNKMLSLYDGANGIKTGYTKKAGRCLVSSSYRNGMQVVSVVINSPQMWERSMELMDELYLNYVLCELYNSENFINKVYTDKNGKKFGLSCEGEFSYPLLENEKNDIIYKINGKNIEEYILSPEKIGNFEIYLKNELIFSQKIFTI